MGAGRREFLKSAGVAALAAASTAAPGAAHAAHEKDKPRKDDPDLPLRLIVGHIKRRDNLTIAVKTDMGVLDVHADRFREARAR